MAHTLKKITLFALFSISIAACGGGGGGGGGDPEPTPTPDPEVPLTSDQINAIDTALQEDLADAGYPSDDYADLSTPEVEAIEEELIEGGLSETQVDQVFDELEIEAPTIEDTIDTTATLDSNNSEVIGIWQLENTITPNLLVSVGRNSITVYERATESDCYQYSLSNVTNQADNDFTISDALSGELSVITLLESDGVLSYQGQELISSTIAYFALADICESTINKTIQVDISLNDLEAQLKLIGGTGTFSVYRWQIDFDINNSGQYDTGDSTFALSYLDDESTIYTETVVDLESALPRYYVAHETEPGVGVGLGAISDTGTLTRTNSTLTFTFDSSIDPTLAYIQGNTPIKVTTIIRHDPNDNTEYGDLNSATDDGPWNWTSLLHEDKYPENGFAESSNMTIQTDNTGDQSGEATWVDIESVMVTVTQP